MYLQNTRILTKIRYTPSLIKTFILLCSKHIHNSVQQILSESTGFCERHDKNILCVFSVHSVYMYIKLNFTGVSVNE